ncbi:MAG: hypothetical protein RIR97_975 [Pseudomonadota bacterium]
MQDEALFARTELGRPVLSASDAAQLFADHYGLSGLIAELGSQQDRNYRIDSAAGRFVLKVSLADYATRELAAQNAAMKHIASTPDAPLVPGVIASKTGLEIVPVRFREQDLQLRLLTYLDGNPLTRQKKLPVETIAGLGRIAGRISRALADFSHPGLERDLQWDARRGQAVFFHLAKSIPDQDIRARLSEAMGRAQSVIQPLAPAFKVQAIHHDVTDDNVVARPSGAGHLLPAGVIDFGDVMNGWLAGDLAVTCSSLLHHGDGDPFDILPAIAAYHQEIPLNRSECLALWPLILARATVLVASGEQQLAIDPDNDYVLGNIAHERLIFDVANSVPIALMQEAICDTLEIPAQVPMMRMSATLFPGLDPAQVVTADFSTEDDAWQDGQFQEPGIADRILNDRTADGRVAASRYGEFRLSETRFLSASAPATFALNVDLAFPNGQAVHAPFDGTIHRRENRLVLFGEPGALHLTGVSPVIVEGVTVRMGDVIGQIDGQPDDPVLVRLQLCRDADLTPPAFAIANHAHIWRRICPSPSALLGWDCDAKEIESEQILVRRVAHFARPQKNYYAHPPQIERGYREHMFDVTGRAFLDMVNNVSILGHGHPRLADAVSRQWAKLNTNSRFHYRSVAEFSERLAGLAPEGLDTVFLVNSGSEAVDLGLRLAWAASGARNIISLLEAYHGWTVASDAVSTSIADNPQALSTRPDWVHPVMSPNTYRGRYRGENCTADYVRAVTDVLNALDAQGQRLGGFICEPVYGNAGGIPLPKGYLTAVYSEVRARGGLCIADEVQVGYGRLGHHFWGFETQGVVPDIITIAKSMGNGHPLGAVITTRAIADSLEKEGYFFSSSGGSPVSSVVGMTVLDILEEEKLQDNARQVGDHLKARLQALSQRYPLVGAVHGMGLYLGLEFVRDRDTLEPATAETEIICNRLLDFGIIMQPTGDYLNILKIKPPLCLSKSSADFFVDMLARTLDEF